MWCKGDKKNCLGQLSVLLLSCSLVFSGRPSLGAVGLWEGWRVFFFLPDLPEPSCLGRELFDLSPFSPYVFRAVDGSATSNLVGYHPGVASCCCLEAGPDPIFPKSSSLQVSGVLLENVFYSSGRQTSAGVLYPSDEFLSDGLHLVSLRGRRSPMHRGVVGYLFPVELIEDVRT